MGPSSPLIVGFILLVDHVPKNTNNNAHTFANQIVSFVTKHVWRYPWVYPSFLDRKKPPFSACVNCVVQRKSQNKLTK